ncbi:SGNH hydrolase-type esterase domain-containing protein [Macrophomina phaseolina]|uniref:SGNH hydrolase-type esterase domain-containing protein n=1 Tax=Macrophomina phaseolina TaxID=35725 RepID=A0ABQ8G862_9PEZI|nr:SGNH hydrolase-type esterase domain-containing protein [Macrophomina phaseolina]
MKLTLAAWLLALAASAVGAPTAHNGAAMRRQDGATPTVYLAGDSTMAEQGGKNGTEGWGHYLQYSLSLPVTNRAFAGRSARSFTDQGRFAAIEAALQPGDFVVIEFGHNDGGGSNLGTANYTDNGRPACPGQGNETCVSLFNGTAVVVHTYNWYLLQAARSFLAKGATVVVGSMTPTNPWEGGSFSYGPPVFVEYARNVVRVLEAEVGGEAAFVDHGKYEADAFWRLGKDVTDSFFLMDHTHTQPEGADVAAKAFVKGLKCGGSKLARYVVNATEEIPGVCL